MCLGYLLPGNYIGVGQLLNVAQHKSSEMQIPRDVLVKNQIVSFLTILAGISCGVTLFVAFALKDKKTRGQSQNNDYDEDDLEEEQIELMT